MPKKHAFEKEKTKCTLYDRTWTLKKKRENDMNLDNKTMSLEYVLS